MGDTPGEGGPNTSGPRIIRPIPRRPFKLGFSSPTPPEEDEDSYSSSRPQISANDLRFLAPHQHAAATPSSGSRDGSTPISHNASYLNLTSPTLFGIYSPSTLDASAKYEDDQDQDQDHYFRDSDRDPGTDTPGDAPAPRPGLDDETYALMRKRSSSHHQPRPSSLLSPLVAAAAAEAAAPRPARKREVALQLVLRAGLLFVLGVGYGVLVTRLPQNSHHQHHPSHRLAAAYESHYEWRYLVFWGVAGVALGSLLPWFDRFWEDTIARSSRRNGSDKTNRHPEKQTNPDPDTDTDPETEPKNVTTTTTTSTPPPPADWALVMRGIGAFVGIVFAIRKLPWASTMQVSLTLALANPFLWYLIDRSKPGFLLSAAVGLAGSAVLMRLGPGVMPAPASGSGFGSGSAGVQGLGLGGGGNATGGGGSGVGAGVGGWVDGEARRGALGGLASQETIETSIWMLSVLFCSCVCFGNIGRRLALTSSAAGRGRWGGVR